MSICLMAFVDVRILEAEIFIQGYRLHRAKSGPSKLILKAKTV